MREVDSSRDNSEARLAQGLRAMAQASPSHAPDELGDALARHFRRHHARRRAIRRTAVAALICLVLPAAILLVTKSPRKPNATRNVVVASPPTELATAPFVASPLPVRAEKAHARSRRNSVATTAGKVAASTDGFLNLPSSDREVRGEDLRVVRLELTGRALRMVGAPVAEDIADRRMLADFIVGQDGTPYAVRLVH